MTRRRRLTVLALAGVVVLAAVGVAAALEMRHRATVACGSPLPRAAGGLPAAATTGVPRGRTLTRSGSVFVNNANHVIDGLDIHGTVTINASCVTLRDSRVTGAGYAIVKVAPGLTNVRIINVTIDGTGLAGQSGSAGIEGPATVIGSDISGVENGLVPANGSALSGNYVHDLLAPGDPHYDGVQIDGGSDISIVGNTIDVHDHGQTSTVMIDNYFGPVSRIAVRANRLIGAGYTVYSDGHFSGGPIAGVSFVDNRMTRGYWGYVAVTDNSPVWTGNVDDGTGKSISDR
jgi:hypothetical protein